MIALLLAMAWGQVELEDVLERVDERVPQLAAAQGEIDRARAELLARRGLFDPTLRGKGAAYAGKDPRSVLETEVGATSVFGPGAAVGYRRGTGAFPAYAGADRTGADGEWVGRIEVPLLKGLGYGPERAELDRAGALIEAEREGYRAARIALRAKASAAYWYWVAAGAELQVYEELLQVARTRRDALELQVERGQRAQIDLLDNERVLFERQSAAAGARGKLERAAVELALYYRDGEGSPVVLDRSELPTELAARVVDLPESLEAARERPDVREARARVQAQESGVRGARNGQLPKLDASVEQSVPLIEGDAETIAGLSLELPFLLRQGRGKLAEQRAKQEILEQELRGLEDRAYAEIEAAMIGVRVAEQQLQAVSEALVRAREVARLERRRFELGGAELFTLVQREERVAKDGLALAAAQRDRGLAQAELERALGWLD